MEGVEKRLDVSAILSANGSGRANHHSRTPPMSGGCVARYVSARRERPYAARGMNASPNKDRQQSHPTLVFDAAFRTDMTVAFRLFVPRILLPENVRSRHPTTAQLSRIRVAGDDGENDQRPDKSRSNRYPQPCVNRAFFHIAVALRALVNQ